MKDDPTITRIRQARHAISEKCGHDPKKLVDYYIELQKRHEKRFTDTSELRHKFEEPLAKT